MASDGAAPARTEPFELRGRTTPWGPLGVAVLAALVLVALWLRLRGLAAGGLADDEVHKWLAANRYLRGDFTGDDVEHPMLMKTLVALATAALRGALPLEALTRLPNAIGGALTVVPAALLGRRLYGRAAGLLGAALLAVAATAVGYHRVGKEDVLFTLFFTCFAWAFAEARAAAQDGRPADQARWERWSAVALGATFASKYFIFYFPIPLLAYFWLRPVSAWRVPFRRWVALIGVALLVFLALDWVALLPSTWRYILQLIGGAHMGDRATSESYLFMGRLWGNLGPGNGDHMPWYFFPLFAAVKFAPVTALLAYAGLARAAARRAPADRLVVVWLTCLLLFSVIAGAKYARFFTFVMPPFLLLAADAALALARAAARLARRAGAGARAEPAAVAVAAALLLVPEAVAAVTHAPHQRMYVSPLGGGDRNVAWWFPHCDYWDAGAREALAWIAAHAEPGAEVATEEDWLARFYLGEDGRGDLVSETIRAGQACHLDRPCYVVWQPGRVYWHNQAALDRLAAQPPLFVARVRGTDAARVYRVAPGQALFPR